ncbi:MAG TPA: outer membrane beta-barrel protein [Gammaproteobacteria bacterium]
MKKKTIAAAIAALMLPAAAIAADADGVLAADKNLSYTFGELAYHDLDAAGASVDGLGVEGSYEFTDMFFGFASFDDIGGEGYDSTTLTVGVGAAIGLTDKVDGYGKLGIVQNDTSFGPSETDDSGFGLEFGVRAMAAENIEVFGDIQYVDIYEDSQTGFELGGRYWMNQDLGFSLAYTDVEDSDGLVLAARYHF